MSVLIECVELSIHRSAKGFRAGFKGFESSLFRLKDSERCGGSSGALRERNRNDGPCFYLDDMRTVHRNQAIGAIPDRVWEALVEPLVKVFHIWPRSLPCCTKSSRQQPSPTNRRRRFPSTHTDPRHGDRRPLSTHSRETDLEALLRDQVNARIPARLPI